MSFLSKNPYTRKVLHELPYCSQSEVLNTINFLHQSYKEHNDLKTSKSKKTAGELKKLSSHLAVKKHDLAKLVSMETGKPITSALAEVQKAVNHCIYFSENIEQYTGTKIIRTEAKKSGYFLDPLGVIYKISPFNFPVWISLKMMVPTLVAGNSVMIRPPSQCGLTGLALNEILENAGMDRARVVFSSSDDTEFVLSNENIQGLSFTGSTSSGSIVGEIAGKHLKRSVLELGGADPFIFLEDGDIDKAVEVAIGSRLANSGQVCFSSKRFIVHSSRIDEFIERLGQASSEKKRGDPLNEETELGPLASEEAADTFEEQIKEIGKSAELVFGSQNRDGNYFEPQGYKIHKEHYKDSILATSEIFGPVFGFFSFNHVEEAIEIANSSQFGLGACIISKNEKGAQELARHIDSGMVFINAVTSSMSKLPCGGVKASGFGRDCGAQGVEAFANIKTFYIGK